MCARICTSPNSSTDSSPQNVLTYISLGQEASYTVLIDLDLTELRNVLDSAAPRSYVDWRSRAFSDSRTRGSARLEATWIKHACGTCSLRLGPGPRRLPDRSLF